MLWLTVAWLWFGLQPPEEIPLSGPLREVYLASSAVGVTTTLAVVGFIAYLIGLALSFRLTLRRSDLRFVSRALVDSSALLATNIELILDAYGVEDGEPLAELESAVYGRAVLTEPNSRESFVRGLREVVLKEERQLTMLLLVANPAMFDKYDRNMSENEFRVSVVPPAFLLVISLILVFNDRGVAGYVLLVLGLAMLVTIFVRGILIGREGTATLLLAVASGLVKSPTLVRMETILKRRTAATGPPSLT